MDDFFSILYVDMDSWLMDEILKCNGQDECFSASQSIVFRIFIIRERLSVHYDLKLRYSDRLAFLAI